MNWAIFETPLQRGAHFQKQIIFAEHRHIMHEQDSIFHGQFLILSYTQFFSKINLDLGLIMCKYAYTYFAIAEGKLHVCA